ncbi:hypothetical protein AMECASPLE_001496 [Ameca splendens]|uniref:Uncharacterized protein n=1 Tax=Ameca splendens TaxID=208324 RepID=A0ABV0XY00_9TELE
MWCCIGVISLWFCWGVTEAQVALTVAFRSTALLSLMSHVPPDHSPYAVNELVDNLHSKNSDIVDSIAPIKVKVVSSKKKALWRNASLVRSECQRVERRWCKTRVKVHHDIYNESSQIYLSKIFSALVAFVLFLTVGRQERVVERGGDIRQMSPGPGLEPRTAASRTVASVYGRVLNP